MPVMPENIRLGFAYVPFQKYENLYDLNEGLKQGTLFKDLDIPFESYASNPLINPFEEAVK